MTAGPVPLAPLVPLNRVIGGCIVLDAHSPILWEARLLASGGGTVGLTCWLKNCSHLIGNQLERCLVTAILGC